MSSLNIIALHHVQLAMPVNAEDAARNFYQGVLGLKEVAKPAALAGRGGVWFTRGAIAVHLGVETPFVPSRKAHVAFAVTDLAGAHASLSDHAPTDISAVDGLRRFYINDPFGNRIEILQVT